MVDKALHGDFNDGAELEEERVERVVGTQRTTNRGHEVEPASAAAERERMDQGDTAAQATSGEGVERVGGTERHHEARPRGRTGERGG